MNQTFYKYLYLLFISVYSLSCQPSSNEKLFNDLTVEETGLDFTNKLSNSEEFNIIDYLYYYDGAGVAVGDINNDGLSDIYLVSNEGDNALFLNQGGLKFKDISESAGVKSPGRWKTGVSMADVNGDGLLDIYLCRLGDYKGVTGKNELYINQGDMTFREEAAKYNLDFVGFSTQAAFFDMDNDGDLDVYLLNHSVHTQRSFGDATLRLEIDSLAGDRIYRNDDNYFTDISSSSGIYRSQIGYGLGIGLSDINKDGFTDIFISNDFMENDYLYLNNQDGTFSEVFSDMADYTSLSSMGSDLADFNNDGFVDIITLDMLPEDEVVRKSTVGDDPKEIFRMKLSYGYMAQYRRNTLQLNRGDGTFSDIAMMAGVHASDWSWSPLFADFDNDGWKDLFISNGIQGRPNDMDYLEFIERKGIKNNPDIPDSVLIRKMPGGKVSNYFFRNNKDWTFQDLSMDWGVASDRITNGIAYSDLDNDGDLDLILNNLDGPAVIKENKIDSDTTRHFLVLELAGAGSNTKAIGAKIEVFYQEEYQFFELFPVRGFKSSVDPRIHIGLGKAESIDSMRIIWPGGGDTVLFDVEADRFMKLVQKEEPKFRKNKNLGNTLFTSISNEELGVDYIHQENTFIEFNREPLIPHMHSTEGPALAVADINGDGWDDFYIGGAKHQEGRIYLQYEGGFRLSAQPALIQDKLQEDVDAAFFDFDNDGDMDLIVVSGGNEFLGNSPNRQPRLYLNDGAGSFSKLPGVFEGVYQTGSCVAIHDFDADGWEDLFLGSLAVPWNYGLAPQSYLLKNDAGRSFIDVSRYLPENGTLGMINDAAWIDLKGSGEKDLVLVGEWMDVLILSTDGKEFKENRIPNSSGWWKTIQSVDYDGDGDQDLLIGNLGLNSKLKTTPGRTLNLYLDDFDQNGRLDPVMTFNPNGEESIFVSRDVLEKQIPSIGQKFSTNMAYAEASLKEILGDGLSRARKLTIHELRSGVFINDGSGFYFEPLPTAMQISFLQDFLVSDLNDDGFADILSVGNFYASSIQEGRYSADRGSMLAWQSSGYQILSNHEIGLSLKGNARRIKSLNFQGNELIMVARNNDSILWLKGMGKINHFISGKTVRNKTAWR